MTKLNAIKANKIVDFYCVKGSNLRNFFRSIHRWNDKGTTFIQTSIKMPLIKFSTSVLWHLVYDIKSYSFTSVKGVCFGHNLHKYQQWKYIQIECQQESNEKGK